MQLIEGIPVWGSPVDEGALAQIKTCAQTADRVAMMADHHKGYAVPIGGVVAYRDRISPSGVGYDIACGNKAVLTDVPASEVRAKIATIMDDVFRIITGVDESPHVYKRLPAVLAEHDPTVRILHTLQPIGVAMAAADTADPYKD